MAGINKVILIGNLGRDPEMRYTQDQNAVATFSVATSEQWTDRNTNERRERTEWHRIVCFRRLAEICGEYLHKGSKVYIEGSAANPFVGAGRPDTVYDGGGRAATCRCSTAAAVAAEAGSADPEDRGGSTRPAVDTGMSHPDPVHRSAHPTSSSPPAEPDDFEDDIPF